MAFGRLTRASYDGLASKKKSRDVAEGEETTQDEVYEKVGRVAQRDVWMNIHYLTLLYILEMFREDTVSKV